MRVAFVNPDFRMNIPRGIIIQQRRQRGHVVVMSVGKENKARLLTSRLKRRNQALGLVGGVNNNRAPALSRSNITVSRKPPDDNGINTQDTPL